jgi:hypothetical protein
MADETEKAFIEVKVPTTDGEVVLPFTGYKAMMRQFAEAAFRAAHKGETLQVIRSGKPFMKVQLDD